MKKDLRCFVIMPQEGPYQGELFERISETVNRFNDLEDYQIEIVRGDSKAPTGVDSLEDPIKAEIRRSDLVIAEVNQRHANVLLELGYAVGLARPVIVLFEENAEMPAEFHGRFLYRFNRNELGAVPRGLTSFLQSAVESIIARQLQTVASITAFPTPGEADLSRRIDEAEGEIDIIATGLESLLASGDIDRILSRAQSNAHLRVRILALDPESDFAAQRARQLGSTAAGYRNRLRRALDETCEKLADVRDRCRVATYDEYPPQISCRIDGTAYLSVVSASHEMQRSVMVRLDLTHHTVASFILSHFDTVWGRSTHYHGAK